MHQLAYLSHPLSTVAPRDLLLLQCMNLRRSDAVLEIGTGSGSSILRLAGKVATIHGVDISAGSIQRMRRELARRKISAKNAEVFALDFCEAGAASRLPVKYDVVFSCDTLEHVSSPDIFLANIHDCLKCDGRAFITFPNETEDRRHGITSFSSHQSLGDALCRAGFSPRETSISTCALTPWAKTVLQAAWLKPRRLLKRVMKRLRTPGASPQVFDQTDFYRLSPVFEPLSPIINAYCWSVMRFMTASKPAFELEPLGPVISDKQILIQARRGLGGSA
jgi:2-polyprenyl-3-methyl-5-hydroxy-6-metoxy-1,4-benzoquinol methylase